MDGLLPEILPSLFSVMLNARMPAYLLVHPDGHLVRWGGPLSFYGIEQPQSGVAIDQHIAFLQGIFPLGQGETLSLPCVETRTGLFAELYICPATVGHWVVLLDVTQEAHTRRLLQQQAHELNLSRIQQAKGIQQALWHTEANPLVATLDAPSFAVQYRDATILCLALRGLSCLEEQQSAADLLATFNLCLRTVVQAIQEEAGVVVKVIDARLVALFGLLPTGVDAPRAAVQAALRITSAVNEIKTRVAENVRPMLNAGIGIASGRVMIGMMGDVGARMVNVLGECVQRAMALSQFAHADEILIEKEVWWHCGDFQARFTEVCLPRDEEKAPIAVFASGAR
jgi:class 3 adenylate cyclase